jgi:hypothetical protein
MTTNVDFDDDTPPDLVDIGAPDVEDGTDTKSTRVPITIVTGTSLSSIPVACFDS